MQRICKYPLLLRELTKATPVSHNEYKLLSSAADIVSDVLSRVNEDKRTTDNVIQLLELKETLPNCNINMNLKSQRIVKQGEFKKVQFDSSKESSKHSVWLLLDTLLVAKKLSKGKYTLRAELPVDSMIVWDLDPNGTSETKNGFSIFCKNTKVIITASNAVEKFEWIEILNERIGQSGFLG